MKKATLLYIQDALCGWCYGMSPVILQLYKAHRQDYNFVVLSGGMVRGSNVQPISGMSNYIRQASKQLEQVTGVKQTQAYHENILDKGTYITNSEPPAIALLILKEQFPEQQVLLAAAIQNVHFVEGKDLNEVETYLPVVRQFGASEEDFKKKFTDKDYTDMARQEFELVEKWGISGFPAVVCEAGEKLYLVAQGYQPYDQLTETLERIQQEASEAK
ncbi:DsbA family protein [Pontibacter pamirensis]|uniref:DsbA family protein n=1 Tax=Pontibacter pamirensis TaxID=2562824 RepID=UPI00138A6485|nr:DsbA family protein [Pontibacter pamirensis]